MRFIGQATQIREVTEHKNIPFPQTRKRPFYKSLKTYQIVHISYYSRQAQIVKLFWL